MIEHRWHAPDGLHAGLIDEVIRRASTIPTHAPSFNVGGWRSDEGLLAWGSREADVVVEHVLEAARRVAPRISRVNAGWAVVHRNGSYHAPHRHGGGWAALYYLTSGGARTGFRVAAGDQFVAPEEGLTVLFRSSTLHWSEPSLGSAPRITLAFDLG